MQVKMPKLSTRRQNITQNTIEFISCWSFAGRHGAAFNCVCETQNVSFVIGCQLEIASRLGMRARVQVPYHRWDPFGLGSVCRGPVYAATVCEFRRVVVFGRQFLWCLPFPLPLPIFLPLPLHSSLSPKRRGLVRTQFSKASQSLHIVQLSVSVLVPVHSRGSFSGDS